MIFYRLDLQSKPVRAFSGDGGLYGAARWHSLGTRLVYTSSSVALACLETLVHVRTLRHPEERWLFTIDVPDRFVEDLNRLPKNWNTEPANDASRLLGDDWVTSKRSVALLVPSVIVSMEKNALINPQHPQFKLDWVRKPTRFRYDPRLK